MINSILKNKVFIILGIIVLFGAIIRFYKIDEYPPSLYWDEISIANNANFIVQTGHDEHGKFLPLLFQGYNDYKSPGNIYLTAIPVKIFGLNAFSARFVSAFLGTLLILVMYFLGKNILTLAGEKKKNTQYFGLLTAFLLAISPWHIQFSRAGFEANSGLFFVTLAIVLFLTSLNKINFKYFYLASLFFALSCYFYRSVFVFAPLFFFMLILINFRIFITRANLKNTILGLLIFIVVLIPFITPMFSSEGMSRNNNVSILNPNNSFERVVAISQKFENSDQSLISKIIYNRRIIYIDVFMENYRSYFSYDFLFNRGDLFHRHNVIGFGQFYLWQIPFFVIGVFGIFFVRKKVSAIIIFWLLIAAIPAALSLPSAHALRSLNMLPAYLIVITAGIYIFYKFIPRKTYLLVSILLGFVVLYGFINFIDAYKKSTIIYSSVWADGYGKLYKFTAENKNKYDKILISGHFWQPYAYALFYENYIPRKYLKTGNKLGFDKYVFGGTAWEKQEEINDEVIRREVKGNKTLVALSLEEYASMSSKMKVVEKIYNHNSELVFILVKYDK